MAHKQKRLRVQSLNFLTRGSYAKVKRVTGLNAYMQSAGAAAHNLPELLSGCAEILKKTFNLRHHLLAYGSEPHQVILARKQYNTQFTLQRLNLSAQSRL